MAGLLTALLETHWAGGRGHVTNAPPASKEVTGTTAARGR